MGAFVRDARSGGVEERELVRRRGRQLASRVANLLGRPVDFVDPVTGAVDRIPVSGTPATFLEIDPALPSESTPWATGLAVAAFFAVLAALGDVAFSQALAATVGLLWVPANLLVGAGLAPALWLVRHVRFWRWPALGIAAGWLVAWLALLLGALESGA
ncbi:MAG: DUF2537 domain-containing protein [Pseudonocardia sp.]